MTCRRPHPLLSLLLTAACLASSSQASEVSARAAAVSGLQIIDAEQTLRKYCTWRQDRLMLVLPSGLEFELITRIDDPDIHNPGDGAFHPFEAPEVSAAFRDVTFPLEGISAEVFILPYPRRGSLESAAGPGLILLSPGVRPLAAAGQHAEAIHELGHVVQHARLPDHDREGWKTYRALRGIADESVFRSSAPHAKRPHEIFAEDFRALFGGTRATTSGTIENAELPAPSQVPGLDRFMLELAAPVLASAPRLSAWPSVTRGRVEFRMVTAAAVGLDLFDIAGRPIVSLAPSQAQGAAVWVWDGRDARGREVPAGVCFARTRDGAGVARVTRLP